MYKNGKYRETDKMSDLICENYPMVLVMSRFGIALGFGEKNIGEVCRQNGVDPCTFLTVVNFLTEEISAPMTNIDKCLSIEALQTARKMWRSLSLNFSTNMQQKSTNTCRMKKRQYFHTSGDY